MGEPGRGMTFANIARFGKFIVKFLLSSMICGNLCYLIWAAPMAARSFQSGPPDDWSYPEDKILLEQSKEEIEMLDGYIENLETRIEELKESR